jgi:hypothetical protein
MAWTGSAVFRAYANDRLSNAAAMAPLTDVLKYAIFGNSITPDKDVAAALTAFGAGQWVTDLSNGNWPAGGVTLTNKAFSNPASGVTQFSYDNPSAGPSVTLTGITGGLTYDVTVSNRGLCFNYLGGSSNAVTASTLTIQVPTTGAFRLNG